VLEHISAAGDHMKDAHKGLTALETALPVATDVLENIKKVSLEWDSVAKKHQVGRTELQELKDIWERDLISMASIASTLPVAIQVEKNALQIYLGFAKDLSTLRSEASKDLVLSLNKILPELNMPENSVLLVESPRKSPSQSGNNDYLMIATATGSPVEKAFSSGEMARLSLAMEGSLMMSDPQSSDILVDNEEFLFVCDEIDAHIGGDASNAAARLLKRIGKTKQVITITRKRPYYYTIILYHVYMKHNFEIMHARLYVILIVDNPLIAAAADMHVVVEKIDGGQHSVIAVVNNELRVAELTRMATGKLEMTAGSDLARALLNINFDDLAKMNM